MLTAKQVKDYVEDPNHCPQMDSPANGDIRVFWIPQIPMMPFYVPVASFEEGRKICKILADYDLFQLKYNVKPDFYNAGGIEQYDGENWFFVEDLEMQLTDTP